VRCSLIRGTDIVDVFRRGEDPLAWAAEALFRCVPRRREADFSFCCDEEWRAAAAATTEKVADASNWRGIKLVVAEGVSA
jgi:hypothetical protein